MMDLEEEKMMLKVSLNKTKENVYNVLGYLEKCITILKLIFEIDWLY